MKELAQKGFIKTISGKQNDATMSINIDLNDVISWVINVLSFKPVWSFIFLVRSARSLQGVWNIFGLCAAVCIDFVITFLDGKTKNKM
jgi:hypothetical protein